MLIHHRQDRVAVKQGNSKSFSFQRSSFAAVLRLSWQTGLNTEWLHWWVGTRPARRQSVTVAIWSLGIDGRKKKEKERFVFFLQVKQQFNITTIVVVQQYGSFSRRSATNWGTHFWTRSQDVGFGATWHLDQWLSRLCARFVGSSSVAFRGTILWNQISCTQSWSLLYQEI